MYRIFEAEKIESRCMFRATDDEKPSLRASVNKQIFVSRYLHLSALLKQADYNQTAVQVSCCLYQRIFHGSESTRPLRGSNVEGQLTLTSPNGGLFLPIPNRS